ncbi:hypothetical protein AB1K70_27075 [Bremerella sp. JC770]|uniref:hypothetical protein n=1 Tax=Bremerella sp. JC770 TaxID=3232137 RepID=UPI0034594A9F
MRMKIVSYLFVSLVCIWLFNLKTFQAWGNEKEPERIVTVEVECNSGKLGDFVVRNLERDAQSKIQSSGIEKIAAKGKLSIRLFGTRTRSRLPYFTVTTVFIPHAKHEGILVAKTQNVSSYVGQLDAVVDGHIDVYVSAILKLEKQRLGINDQAKAIPLALPANGTFTLEMINRLESTGELAIMSSDGKFLGYVSKDRFDEKSIANKFGEYGGKFGSASIFNKLGEYGSKVSHESVSNSTATDPPTLYYNKVPIAYVTTNEQLSPRVHPDVLAVVIANR